MKHKHELIVDLSGLIKCRTCGEVLPYAETELCRVSSARMANRTLAELAIKGKLQPVAFHEGFIVYANDKNGVREEITARKKSDRVYVITQTFISKI